MKVRIDWMDGRYLLDRINGRTVDLPWWVVLLWRVTDRVLVWIDRKYVVVADNAAYAAEEENRRGLTP